MTKFVERRCRECGEGRIRLVEEPGRKASYKFVTLDVPSTLAIPTCDRCGTQWHNEGSAKEFDEAMEAVYRHWLTSTAQSAIERIEAASISQAEAERAIGLSPGYLSKIKRTERVPEASLVTLLTMFANAPIARLAETRAMRGLSAPEEAQRHQIEIVSSRVMTPGTVTYAVFVANNFESKKEISVEAPPSTSSPTVPPPILH